MQAGQAGRGADPAAQFHENQAGAVERGVPAELGLPVGGGFDAGGDQRSGAHRRVVGEDAAGADGGHGGGSHDDQTGWRDVEGRVLLLSVTDNDSVTNVLMQLSERGRAENYLVFLRDGMTRHDRRGKRGAGVSVQDGDVLPVDFGVVMVGSGPCGDVAVTVEQREGLRGDVVAGVEDVGPVPSVERGMGNEGLQAAAEGKSRRHHRHGEDRSQHR